MRLSGRGVHVLPGGRARLVLDDPRAEAEVDCERRRIRFRHEERCPRLRLVGDLLVLGEGRTAAGDSAPFAVHTRFDKRRTTFKARPHLHPSVREPLAAVEALADWELSLDNGLREERVLDRERAVRAALRPPLADRIGRALLSVEERAGPGAAFRVFVGIGPLRRAVLDATLRGPDGVDPLEGGRWQLSLEVLSRLASPNEHVRRGLFLFGLEGIPGLSERFERLGPGWSLSVDHGPDGGTLRSGGVVAPTPPGLAEAFFAFDFLGGILRQRLLQGALRPGSIVL